MAASKIEWTDEAWNPVTGCSKVSAGCKNCYAERLFPRIRHVGGGRDGGAMQFGDASKSMRDGGPRQFSDVWCHEDRLAAPLRWRKPRRVFVNSMSDLFHGDVPVSFIARVFNVMACATPQCGKRHEHGEECWTGPPHTFQVLTKRPERMLKLLSDELPSYADNYMPGDCPLNVMREAGEWPLPNVWLGISCEDQKSADERIPLLLQTPAAVRFLSCEPLLGPIRFDAVPGAWGGVLNSLHWVIVGGESGPGARPCDVGWIRSIVQQCKAALVPCFVNQLGAKPIARDRWDMTEEQFCDADASEDGWSEADGPIVLRLRNRKGGDPAEWPEDLRVREFPEATA